ncbi:hypothetical protein K469DRAFT_17854 [Zopfia rhizophila CBS 207.26]|uniref:Uncharacterized protein n=1 Tax=Zopfia rhizophila CBS 207.26 TaxID=1314779 RepID=A0A6A6EXS8_9PEZI|nr:hypothetical protein K469DRAFT_17854 [Zopfia rhizophila CBS 207.26]
MTQEHPSCSMLPRVILALLLQTSMQAGINCFSAEPGNQGCTKQLRCRTFFPWSIRLHVRTLPPSVDLISSTTKQVNSSVSTS